MNNIIDNSKSSEVRFFTPIILVGVGIFLWLVIESLQYISSEILMELLLSNDFDFGLVFLVVELIPFLLCLILLLLVLRRVSIIDDIVKLRFWLIVLFVVYMFFQVFGFFHSYLKADLLPDLFHSNYQEYLNYVERNNFLLVAPQLINLLLIILAFTFTIKRNR